jgi:hypothetical protein
MAMHASDYDITNIDIAWCPGCGNFGIQAAMKQALANLNIDPHMIALVAGIGCSSKMPHWVDTYGLHTLHGRAIPPAQGIKLANPKLKVVVISGDGDLIFEGEITGYDTKPIAFTGNDQTDIAALNRLTITVSVKFTNKLDETQDFEQNFSRYADYLSTLNLSSVEETLIKQINEQLVEDIFNKAVVNW